MRTSPEKFISTCMFSAENMQPDLRKLHLLIATKGIVTPVPLVLTEGAKYHLNSITIAVTNKATTTDCKISFIFHPPRIR